MTKDEALKMALRALELWHNAGEVPTWYGRQDRIDAMNALRQALNQLPDTTKMIEPSMGLIASEWAGLKEPPNSTTDVVEDEIHRLQELADYRLKLLTKMPSEWVGLSDDEALDVWGKVDLGQTEEQGALLLCNAIEAKLKEKNT